MDKTSCFMEHRIRKIIEGWYIYDNALFEISLTHRLQRNDHMLCPMRCGGGVIEYNESVLQRLPDRIVAAMLKVECVRIILKHPYERQPEGTSADARLIASNITIGDNYAIPDLTLPVPALYSLPEGKSYEWYAYHLPSTVVIGGFSTIGFYTTAGGDNSDIDNESRNGNGSESGHRSGNGNVSESGNGSGNDDDGGRRGTSGSDNSSNDGSGGRSGGGSEFAAHSTGLWKEDSFMKESINLLIDKLSNIEDWGNLDGKLVQTIKGDTRHRIDYRKVLGGFRASIYSENRRLTRMRPNRRTGFENMGSLRALRTRLLVAVDVSASVSDTTLQIFFSVVRKAFKYGIKTIDLITFDAKIQNVMDFSKGMKAVTFTGRGGTNFQIVIDYAHAGKYDGVLIFTDGIAPVPELPPHPRFKVVWVIDSMKHYLKAVNNLGRTGRCCPIED